jgi:hypothetical protein
VPWLQVNHNHLARQSGESLSRYERYFMKLARDNPNIDWVSRIALAVSGLALLISGFSAYVTWSSTVVSRRPIVVVESAIPLEPFKVNAKNFTKFQFKNAGTTPALSVVVSGKSEIVRRIKGSRADFDHYAESQSENVVGPNAEFIQNILISPLSPQDVGDIHAQSALVYVHGLVKYEDMWKKAHWLKFCYKLDPLTATYYPCQENNVIDN